MGADHLLTRRGAIAGLLAASAVPAAARVASFGSSSNVIADISPARTPTVRISYGQSWASNSFDSFGGFSLPSEAGSLVALHVPAEQNGKPGLLPNGAGIFIPSTPDGSGSYASSDAISIGRCSVLAQQLLRARDGVTLIAPILEFCAAFPSSTWTSGVGGGLAPGAVINASITGSVMTVNSTTSGVMAAGQKLVGSGVNATTLLFANNGDGTWKTCVAAALSSVTLTGTTPSASFVADLATGVLNVTQINSGSLAVNQTITGPANLPTGSIIAEQLTGTAGGVGTYRLAQSQSVASTAINCNGTSWANQATLMASVESLFPKGKLNAAVFRDVIYTQGGSVTNTVTAKAADLTAMLTAYDALNLPGAGTTQMQYFLSIAAPESEATQNHPSWWGTYGFCRTHAPGQGGTWSGRCWATTPWYQWPFSTSSDPAYGDIHTGPYGTVREGDVVGYVAWLVEDKGVAWTPLWRSLTAPITVSGQIVTVPFDRPPGPDFAAKPMMWQSSASDGIKVWPQNGFHVRRSGVELTVAPTISGLNVLLAITETISSGDVLEVSYAWYGPGGTNPGPNSGVGGNLVMNGPASVLFPGSTIDAWAWPFLESVTVP